jgi:hypothetical protein
LIELDGFLLVEGMKVKVLGLKRPFTPSVLIRLRGR